MFVQFAKFLHTPYSVTRRLLHSFKLLAYPIGHFSLLILGSNLSNNCRYFFNWAITNRIKPSNLKYTYFFLHVYKTTDLYTEKFNSFSSLTQYMSLFPPLRTSNVFILVTLIFNISDIHSWASWCPISIFSLLNFSFFLKLMLSLFLFF